MHDLVRLDINLRTAEATLTLVRRSYRRTMQVVLVQEKTMRRCFSSGLAVLGLACGVGDHAYAAPFTFSTIDAPGASDTFLTGINASEQVTGYTASGAFLDNAGTFTSINVPGAMTQFAQTVATGINNNGQITGYYAGAYGSIGFVDTSGKITSVSETMAPAYAGGVTTPAGINDFGVLVGAAVTTFGGPNGFYNISFVGSSLLTIPAASGSTFFGSSGIDVVASGINDAGQIVGTYNDGVLNQGFLDAAGVITMITAPNAIAGTTTPKGINNLGEITGTYRDANGTHGFVDTDGAFTTFDVLGSFPGSTNAVGINDAGDVVGYYLTASAVHGFVATPVSGVAVPEPASLALLGTTIAGFGIISRRRRLL